jgi:hypothetical protein
MASSDDLPTSHDRLALADPPAPGGPRVPGFLERLVEDLQDIGMGSELLERFTKFWKHFGLRKTIILFLAITIPIWRYEWIPSTVSSTLATWAQKYEVNLEVEDWTSHMWNIAVTGEKLVVETRGPYADKRLVQADSIDLDWNLMRGMGNAWKRLGAIVSGTSPIAEPVHEIRLKDAKVHIERLLSGRWNFQDAIAESEERETISPFRLPELEAEGLRVEWIEHLPGDSGGGLIEQKTATLYLDDVKLRLVDLLLPEDTRDDATGFTVEGRTADGRFSITGKMNVTRWLANPTLGNIRPSTEKAAFFSQPGDGWSPSFKTSLYLENVGAAALARVLAPDLSIIPNSGTMTGRIDLAVTQGLLKCAGDVQLNNVSYAANPRSSYVKTRREEVERGVKDVLSNGPVSWNCDANWGDPNFRVAKAVQTGLTSAALKNAAPAIQAAAAYDQLRFVKMDPRAQQESFSESMSGELGRAVGGETGAIIAKQLAKPDNSGTSPIGRGMKSVGRGFKSLFGGGKKDNKRPPR